MPYFRWKGINLQGEDCSGVLCAVSDAELTEQLEQRDISLLSYTHIKSAWWTRSIKQEEIIQFFKNMEILLDAGLTIPLALELSSYHIQHIGFHDAIHTIKYLVDQGVPLARACADYPHLFTPLMIETMRAGVDAGDLISACSGLSRYLERIHMLRKKIYMSLMVPSITFIFFIIVTTIIVMWIVPLFSSFFVTLGQPIPATIEYLLQVKQVVSMHYIAFFVTSMGLGFISYWIYKSNQTMAKKIDLMVFYVPIIGSCMRTKHMMYLSQAAALLLKRGVLVVDAFDNIAPIITNNALHADIMQVNYAIRAGVPLSEAFSRYMHRYVQYDMITLLKVGEKSGNLGRVFEAIAHQYEQKIEDQLGWFMHILQPALIIIIGLCIVGLIIAVYMPLMSFSWIVK